MISGGNSPKQVKPAASSPASTACAGCGTSRQGTRASVAVPLPPAPRRRRPPGSVVFLFLVVTTQSPCESSCRRERHYQLTLTPESFDDPSRTNSRRSRHPNGPYADLHVSPRGQGKVSRGGAVFRDLPGHRPYPPLCRLYCRPWLHRRCSRGVSRAGAGGNGAGLRSGRFGQRQCGQIRQSGFRLRQRCARAAGLSSAASKIAPAAWERLAFAWAGIWPFARP